MPNNRVRLSEKASIGQLNDGNLTLRIRFKKFRCPRFARGTVDFDPLIRQTKIVDRKPNLVAVFVEGAKEVRYAQFGDVVCAPTYHRFEDLWDNPSAVEGYVRALDLN
jgi:hypothetical protein